MDHIVENRCPVPVRPVDWSRLDDSSQTPIEMDAKSGRLLFNGCLMDGESGLRYPDCLKVLGVPKLGTTKGIFFCIFFHVGDHHLE